MKSVTPVAKLFTLILLAISGHGFSQHKCRIYFKDKAFSTYDPHNYLDAKAIERRNIHNLNLLDSSDFPVSESYSSQVEYFSDSIIGISRWMNAMFIFTTPEKLESIKKLSFVKWTEVVEPGGYTSICSDYKNQFDTSISYFNKELLLAQIDRMNGKLLAKNHLDGTGIRIAILDAGFKSYLNNPAFEEIRKRNGIIGTYDFVKKRTNADIGMTHGTNVFSCIGGQLNNNQFGLATGAEFLLARTESVTEFFSEEENWLLAAEWADKNGADIINSSLGYTFQRYLPENMDGKTTFISKAAQIAVDKGILVVSSAGNEGAGRWKRVAAPGDAEGVLTVGAISPSTGIKSDFSSFGPSWDKRLKPEVSAYGTAIVAGTNGYTVADGTSFSSPLVAGFAACLKQKYPSLKNTELKELICRSGDLWPYYDYAHGYGVPQPYFLLKDTLENSPTLSIIEDNFDITLYPIEWDDTSQLQQNDTLINNTFITPVVNDSVIELKIGDPNLQIKDSLSIDSTKITINTDTLNSIVVDSSFTFDSSIVTFPDSIIYSSTDTSYFFSDYKTYYTQQPNYLFYHIKNKKGYLDRYYVMDLEDEENGSVSISKTITEKPFTIAIYYKGYYKELIIKE